MEEVIKHAPINRKARNVVHRVNKDWNNKITATLTKDTDTDNLPKSAQQKKR